MARVRMIAQIIPATRVVEGIRWGSVVAYEALCSLSGHQVRALVPLGSSPGIPNLIFGRLDPAPRARRGVWPGPETLAWTNVADAGDVVVLAKDLWGRFGERVRSTVVHNGVHAHDATDYLTDRVTGEAIDLGPA